MREATYGDCTKKAPDITCASCRSEPGINDGSLSKSARRRRSAQNLCVSASLREPKQQQYRAEAQRGFPQDILQRIIAYDDVHRPRLSPG